MKSRWDDEKLVNSKFWRGEKGGEGEAALEEEGGRESKAGTYSRRKGRGALLPNFEVLWWRGALPSSLTTCTIHPPPPPTGPGLDVGTSCQARISFFQ
jgi:hypothetical protein